MTAADPATLRPAAPQDVEQIAAVWYEGWRESHLGHVPDALLAHRTPEQFLERVPVILGVTTVAVIGGRVAGLVVVHDDEIEQLYVAADDRGSGIAAALLSHGEAVVAEQHRRAFLAVVAGNARARRFYERQGWEDAGPFDYEAWTPAGPGSPGQRVPVPCHRYEKTVRPTPF